jgi:hypothetical protein
VGHRSPPRQRPSQAAAGCQWIRFRLSY